MGALLVLSRAMYKSVGSLKSAVVVARRCVAVDPEHEECKAWCRQLQSLHKLMASAARVRKHKDWDSAASLYRRALRVDEAGPHRFEAHVGLCRAHGEVDQPEPNLDPKLTHPHM